MPVELINKGSYGCIYKGIKCNKNEKIEKDKISKLQLLNKFSTKEKHIVRKINMNNFKLTKTLYSVLVGELVSLALLFFVSLIYLFKTGFNPQFLYGDVAPLGCKDDRINLSLS